MGSLMVTEITNLSSQKLLWFDGQFIGPLSSGKTLRLFGWFWIQTGGGKVVLAKGDHQLEKHGLKFEITCDSRNTTKVVITDLS